jgi:hypothetical protein
MESLSLNDKQTALINNDFDTLKEAIRFFKEVLANK